MNFYNDLTRAGPWVCHFLYLHYLRAAEFMDTYSLHIILLVLIYIGIIATSQ